MPSKYRPQVPGWIGDLEKGTQYITGSDDRLLYTNDNYCAFIRKIKSDQIFYLCASLFLSILSIFVIPGLTYGLTIKSIILNSSERLNTLSNLIIIK